MASVATLRLKDSAGSFVVADASLHGEFQTSGLKAWWTVFVLFLFYMFSNIDRTVITMLVQPIKHDLNVGDFGMGLLLGPAFGLFFAGCGLPMGFFVDRFNRKKMLYVGISAWSAAAAFCGLASSFSMLFIGRAGVGIGEAVLLPVAYSIIADIMPRHFRFIPARSWSAARWRWRVPAGPSNCYIAIV
jgi:MFS family permease